MSKAIFREASLERLSTPEQLDQVMRVTSPTAWMAMIALFLVVAGGLAWSVMGTVPIKVTGKGILISPGGVLDVVSASQGRITSFAVHPGDRIAEGQVVAQLAQPDITAELETSRGDLEEARSQFQKISAFDRHDLAVQKAQMGKKREALTQKIGFLEDRLKWLKEREGYETELREKGLLDRKRVIDTKIDINKAREELATTQNDIKQISIDESTLEITKERELLELEMKVSTLTRKVDTLTEKLGRNVTIVSPYSGQIVEFKYNAGEMVEPGKALFTMVPSTRLAQQGDAATGEVTGLVAKLYVSAEDGKKIRVGMEAQIAPSTVKREEYGFVLGEVRHVAAVPSSEEGMLRILKNRTLVQELSGGAAPFEVTVALKSDPATPTGFRWSSSRGPEGEINSGTLCEGHLTVREIRLISLIIPALEQMFEPMQR
ncbi:MAG: NHLP bacteriocin system secretion protein [Alphaproteobacteria bacterium]